MFPSKVCHAPIQSLMLPPKIYHAHIQLVILPSKVCHAPIQSLMFLLKICHAHVQSLSCSHPKPVIFMPSWHTVVSILWNGVKRVKLWQFTLILLNGVKWVKLWQLTQSCRACVPTIVLITHTPNSIGGGNIKDTGAVSCAVGLIGIILITSSWKWPGMWHRHCQYTQP